MAVARGFAVFLQPILMPRARSETVGNPGTRYERPDAGRLPPHRRSPELVGGGDQYTHSDELVRLRADNEMARMARAVSPFCPRLVTWPGISHRRTEEK